MADNEIISDPAEPVQIRTFTIPPKIMQSYRTSFHPFLSYSILTGTIRPVTACTRKRDEYTSSRHGLILVGGIIGPLHSHYVPCCFFLCISLAFLCGGSRYPSGRKSVGGLCLIACWQHAGGKHPGVRGINMGIIWAYGLG